MNHYVTGYGYNEFAWEGQRDFGSFSVEVASYSGKGYVGWSKALLNASLLRDWLCLRGGRKEIAEGKVKNGVASVNYATLCYFT